MFILIYMSGQAPPTFQTFQWLPLCCLKKSQSLYNSLVALQRLVPTVLCPLSLTSFPVLFYPFITALAVLHSFPSTRLTCFYLRASAHTAPFFCPRILQVFSLTSFIFLSLPCWERPSLTNLWNLFSTLFFLLDTHHHLTYYFLKFLFISSVYSVCFCIHIYISSLEYKFHHGKDLFTAICLTPRIVLGTLCVKWLNFTDKQIEIQTTYIMCSGMYL